MNLRLIHSVAEAEDVLEEPVEPLAEGPKGFAILSRRFLPGSRLPIDHILIGPSGIYAVVRKKLMGTVKVVKGHLTVNGVARNGIADQAQLYTSAIQRIVTIEFGELGIPVMPIVCVEGTEPPKNAEVAGVRLVSARGLGRLLQKAKQELSKRDVESLARVLGSRLLQA